MGLALLAAAWTLVACNLLSTPEPTPTPTLTPTLTPAPTSTPTPTPVPLGFLGHPVARNADWKPVIRDFDGVEMALVPVGCFMMGSSEEEIDYALESCETYYGGCRREWFEDEAPPHEVCFEEPFWIDVHEVTNAQYGSSGEWSGSDLPRESVDWFDAVDHCESRGARLPTEAEWEYAVRGPDGLVFPWGNTFDSARLNYCDLIYGADTSMDDGYEYTAPVGSYPGGVSWVGAYDLSGNVVEWVSSLYEPYPYSATDGREVDGGSNSSDPRGMRGGGWGNYPYGTRAADRDWFYPDYANTIMGFRCARDYDPADLTP
jgi:formylglycine-generating enzyme required for sulfatase activity